MTDLTPTLRAALDVALEEDYIYAALTTAQRAELTALRDACPEPPWLPTEDGLAVYVDSDGFRSVYYVRDGKVARFLRPDGTLLCPHEHSEYDGTWEPCPEVTR